jgi:PAS domain S-box-containing protein
MAWPIRRLRLPALWSRGSAQAEIAHLRAEAAERERALHECAEEARNMQCLFDFSTRMMGASGLQPLLAQVMDAMIALHEADFGLVQIVDPASGDLLIAAEHGLPDAFLTHFARTRDDTAIYARAMQSSRRVIIEDAMTDPGFAPHRPFAAAAGFRTVQSTPLIACRGEMLGVISTHFRARHHFSGSVLRFTDLYARHAAHLLERSRAEQALRTSEERFRRYFDLGLIGMALTSPGKGCLEANAELCRILGYTHDELLQVRWPDITHPDDLAADVAQFDRVVAGEQDGYVLDKRFIRKDGRVIHATMAVGCLRTADGAVDCFVALVQDVTARLETDEALQRARDQLAHMARVAAMAELASSIAHEMNQPLAAIVANGNASRRWLAASPPDLGEAGAAIDRIVAEGHRASQVIARTPAFLRRGETERVEVDLQTVLVEVASFVGAELRARGVKLQIEAGADLPRILGDRVQLQQVVLHLVINAAEAMATVAESRRRLRMQLALDSPGVLRVSVIDAGSGLPAGHRDQVFEAFYTTKPTGMGMGLAISRSIVEAHGGRLWSTPNADGGEAFSFTLSVRGVAAL